MGYTKIVQFGDTIEIYSYEKEIKKSKGIDALKAERLLDPKRAYARKGNYSVAEKRKKEIRLRSQAQGLYRRSDASIRRSKQNFFRMVHHNNCMAKSIHFLTLTYAYDVEYKKARQYNSDFIKRITKGITEIPISYISVPELTKEGRYHFHLLVYNLPPEIAGAPISIWRYNRKRKRREVVVTTTERFTRNLQRQFYRGYLDILYATYNSKGIAGYMAKYMAKALGDERNQARRGYNCSRNLDRFRVSGGNTLSDHLDLIIPTDFVEVEQESSYDIPYLGTCQYKKIRKI